MASLAENINDVARAIQLALAPVFLLTGIAAMLSVMTGRLSRIIDRGRALTERPPSASEHVRSAISRNIDTRPTFPRESPC